MAKSQINWKVAADRATVGERVELVTLPGYWVRPRHYSKLGEAEILAAQTRSMAKSRAVASSVIDAYIKKPSSDVESMIGGMSIEDQKNVSIKVMEGATAETVGHQEEDVMRIAFGVEDHNFKGEPSRASVEWAREIMPYGGIANEILELVVEKNRPLARRTSPSSETSLNGSMKEQDSPAKPM
jgi:hypothetical protein